MSNLNNEITRKYVKLIMSNAIKENDKRADLRSHIKEYEYNYNDFVKDSFDYCMPFNIKLELIKDFEKEEVYNLFACCLSENIGLDKSTLEYYQLNK